MTIAAVGLLAVVAGAAVIAAYVMFVRPWHMTLGCTADEAGARLPGDELIAAPRLQATHAISIRARPFEVWPWLIQMGQGRGGFYSYDRLEQMFGCEIYNVREIVAHLQHLRVGDGISLHVKAPALNVFEIRPHQAIVLAGGPELQPDMPPDRSWYRFHTYQGYVWSFTLREQADGSTRLITRIRVAWNRDHLGHFVRSRIFLEPVHTFMQRKMNRTIKELVEERRARARTA
ncbi:MAG TPA: hypothetical protein VFK70_09835 [Vicinamibacteria bacterium]|nr:hypothetical protein [Vicinamibacteria bacterium]